MSYSQEQINFHRQRVRELSQKDQNDKQVKADLAESNQILQYLRSAQARWYNPKYFRNLKVTHEAAELTMGEYLKAEFSDINKVIDFGCGLGSFILGMKRSGCEVVGLEKFVSSAKVFYDEEIFPLVKSKDILDPSINHGEFDLSMSMEVAEHLPAWYADNFVDNLTKHSTKYVLFTAARPGQKGKGHINCQPKSYWIEKVEARGFEFQDDITRRISGDWEFMLEKNLHHFPKNLMFFQKK